MAKQRISEKKLRKCESVTGRKYHSGWARGGWPHHWFECWWEDSTRDADFVNPVTGEWKPRIRDGSHVSS